ncbi:G protein pathway suppressor 2 isoform X2 [Zootermopsis nevadensis]|uniref:G protein pathway suppressor 2 isoform X2 n=1 Tax=Zootermopsis nevadensis TaxID=136037 RepID=UPI000B8EBC73|nr:G protein pathway suppressor 2 isoform X2 [Zootermopsis nevadensis]
MRLHVEENFGRRVGTYFRSVPSVTDFLITSNMPAVIVGRPKRSEAMWEAIKNHIIRERQKKKQEQEADAEVERQRKERERKQKQDVMTLGETRDQISQLEVRLAQLKDEKHQLFLQLKKVLNEDDNRRRQLVKESNENMISMHSYPTVALSSHPQLFLQQNLSLPGRPPIYKIAPTHGTQHSLLPPGALKRSRSPSPPPNYHQYGFKPVNIPAYPQQKIDDGRRGHEYGRAVLWNKNTQYTGSQQFYAPHGPQQVPAATTVSYSPSPAQQTVYTYTGPQYAQPPPGAAAAPPRDDTGKQTQHSVYLGQPPRANLATIPPHSQAYVSPLHQPMEHSAQKTGFPSAQEAAEKYYSVSPIRPATHVPIHGGAIPIQQPPQGAKTGGITSGYPIRAQPVPAPPHAPSHVTTGSYQPNVSTPHSVYVTQAPSGRLLYSQAGPAGHPPPPGHPPPQQGRYTVPGLQREM